MNPKIDKISIMFFTKTQLLLFIFIFQGFIILLPSLSFEEKIPLQDPTPDYIFYNGTIITMEETQLITESVAVLGDIISAVGNESETFRFADSTTQFINMQGATLVPGFIDSHSHWIGDRGLTNMTELTDVIDSLISYGWTSISELFVNQDRLNELQAVDEANLLKIRVNCYLPLGYGFNRFGDWYQAYTPGYEYSPQLRIAGVKLFADGWYLDPINYINQTEMNQLVQEAHSWGFQIATHSVTPNATDIVLNAYESVIGNEPNNLRHRIEHLVLLRNDQIFRLAELNILGCIQLPWFNSDWNDHIEPLIGREWAEITGRWQDLLDAGVHLLGSTDYPYVLGDIRTPLGVIATAVTRIGTLGDTPTDFMLNQTITPEQALRTLTTDGAYGTFQENIKGSIKFGKLADLVVLSDNPLTIPETNLKNIEVLMTMINGEFEYIKPDSPDTTSSFSSTSMISTTTGTLGSTSTTIPPLTTSAPFLPFIILGVLLIGIIRTRNK
ncbi:amidohydrolase [Candidatus Hodarchaeum mangrovi]